MDEENTKEVLFCDYCCKCKYENTPEKDPPCDDCLVEPMNINSHKPVKFEPKEAQK